MDPDPGTQKHVDPHHLDAVPDFDFLLNADPDPTFHTTANADPDPSFQRKTQTQEKVIK
jgi:hypothetical protein